MAIFRLAILSLFNRKLTAFLTVVTIAISVVLLLGVERIRQDAETSFTNTISGTDLIVGARSGSIQLLLYAVFRIGHATNNIDWKSYQTLAARPGVKWTIPLSLGDSHHGFRVLGTNADYFKHYHYGQGHALSFSSGAPFQDLYDAVLGYQVAKSLKYVLNQSIVIAHGLGQTSFALHDDKPFRVVGILKPTGTPVDQTIHISLEGIEAIHADWQNGARILGQTLNAEQARHVDLTPKLITAFLVGLESKLAIFHVQRMVNEYAEEPLLAILPGVALQELWDMMSVAQAALFVISVLVVISAFLGTLNMILSGLNERRREIAILRSVGATLYHILGLLVAESGMLALLGVFLGVVLLYILLIVMQPVVESQLGLFIAIRVLSLKEMILLGVIVGIGCLAGAIPALQAYRYSLADGMTVRI